MYYDTSICESLRNILDELNEKEKYVKTALKKLPKGNLRISHSRGKPLYYIDEGKKERYIRKKDKDLAKSLAEKSYLERLERCLLSQMDSINNFLNEYSDSSLADVYYRLSEDRRNLVFPMYISDVDYAKQWKEKEYKGKEFMAEDTVYYTNRNECVRSKSEKIIADKLDYYGIPYKYECPITLKGNITIYPDFTVLNVRKRREYYWEHCGMMDDESYNQRCLARIMQYEKNDIFVGKKLILSQETSQHPLDTKLLDKYIETYLL